MVTVSIRRSSPLFVAVLLPVLPTLSAQEKTPRGSAVVAPSTSPEFAGYFRQTRAIVSGDRARDVVAFMEKLKLVDRHLHPSKPLPTHKRAFNSQARHTLRG